MGLLLGCQGLTKAYGASPLFTDLAFAIHDGDRIGLVGPNGAGKSTLLRVIAGLEEPDAGTVAWRRQTAVAFVPQHPDLPADRSVFELVAAALEGQELDDVTRETRVRTIVGRCGFPDPDAKAGTLSGGWQKRLAVARALVTSPDVLLMDEPTNHLDLDGILWLERLLKSEAAAFLVVSHDRWFLENTVERVLDLDRVHAGGFFETRGRYSEFLERKNDALREQAHWQATLANRVRNEVEWLRRGPKARTRKSQARIDEAGRLQETLATVSDRLDRRTATVDFSATGRRTKRLLAVEHVSKRYGDRRILDDANLVLGPGTRLGILGPNGSGKSTLIKILTGVLAPDAGRVERADGLRMVTLDQERTAIDPDVTLRRALAPEGDQVVFGGRPIHVAGWAQRFLFQPEQLPQAVGRLSGGERARVLIARLMLEPADVLVLDEPTNDLDIPTLEVLEESLLEFPGAVVLVTHDRFMFERVTTHTLALDGSGTVTPYADYRQWETAHLAAQSSASSVRRADSASPPKPKRAAKKLTWAEQREWDGMEEAILASEEALAAAESAAADPAIASVAHELAARCQALDEARAVVERLYARWAELEEKRGG